MNRITDGMLESAVKRINVMTRSPEHPYEGGKAQIDNYHLSSAYGGMTLHRMFNEAGGVTSVFSCGYVTKRELYTLMHAFIKGYQQAVEDLTLKE